MSIYYAFLNNVDSSTIITSEYWNALVGEQQATDDLLIGSMYPWAMTTSVSSTNPTAYWVQKTPSTSWIRYYETSGVFKNSNNQDCIQVGYETIGLGPATYKWHKILVPGLYAWNIGWGELWSGSPAIADDQVYSVKVKKAYNDDIASYRDPDVFTVLGEYRSITTSWAYTATTNRYHTFSTSFGMGYPLRSYSGMHFFNAPPYSDEYEYIIFEFSSSIITTASSIYFSRMVGPNITLMKVR